MRSGFYETFSNKIRIVLPGDAPLPAKFARVPPSIRLSKTHDSVVDRDRLVLSGMVEDDVGLAHVTVWQDDDKLTLADGGGLRAIPFSADVVLKPGLNTLTIVATDQDGMTATRSVVVSYDPPEVTAKVDEAPGPR